MVEEINKPIEATTKIGMTKTAASIENTIEVTIWKKKKKNRVKKIMKINLIHQMSQSFKLFTEEYRKKHTWNVSLCTKLMNYTST